VSNLSERLSNLPRPPRQDRRLLILFLVLNAAIVGTLVVAYLVFLRRDVTES
jgi:hypothetical protein